MADIKVITADDFESTIADGVVIVDFYADWCGPCKMMAPKFEQAQDDFAGKASFVKINVDDNQALAVENQVMSIPTLMFFKDGKLADRVMGVIDDALLASKINALL
jgi:thioredoxin 1